MHKVYILDICRSRTQLFKQASNFWETYLVKIENKIQLAHIVEKLIEHLQNRIEKNFD